MPTKIDLRRFRLGKGSHSSIERGACVMELASYLAHREVGSASARPDDHGGEMKMSSRPILYGLALTILAAVFGWVIWRYAATLAFCAVGWGCWRGLMRRSGRRVRRARRPGLESVTQVVEAVSQAAIAWNMRGVEPPKREKIPAGPQARYRLRSSQAGPDDPRWDDPEWPYRG